MKFVFFILALAVIACSDEPSKSANNDGATSNNVATNNDITTNNDVTTHNGTLSCDQAIDAFFTTRSDLPTACTDSGDCQLIDAADYGDCAGSAQADADLTELGERREDMQKCSSTSSNNFVCKYPQAPQMTAACVEGECEAIPACDQLRWIRESEGAQVCGDAADCEVRTDWNECGCPMATAVDADLPVVPLLIEQCDYSETCALIDCAVGESASCEDGLCVLE